jgi:hypothetical protein
MAQWLRHLPTEQGIPGSNPGVIDKFFFVKLTLFSVFVQLLFQVQIVLHILINEAIFLSLFYIDLVDSLFLVRIQQLFLVELNQVYDDDLILYQNQTMLIHL